MTVTPKPSLLKQLPKLLRPSTLQTLIWARRQGGFQHPYRHPHDYNFRKSASLPNRTQEKPYCLREASGTSYTYFDWHAAADTILAPLHQLLAPPAHPCLACGKVISDSAKGYPEICSSCYAAIPWIRKPRCPVCGRSMGCPDCTREDQRQRHYVMNRSAIAYTPLMREWLARYKFRGDESLGRVLARMAGEGMRRLEGELRPRSQRASKSYFDLVTYVPVSSERMLERGFNQSRSLAAEAARAGGTPLLELLLRSRHTEKQSSKSRAKRLKDLQGVFILSDEAGARMKALIDKRSLRSVVYRCEQETEEAPDHKLHVLLVDDVYTTGSTLNACSAVLHRLFASLGLQADIYCLTWARS